MGKNVRIEEKSGSDGPYSISFVDFCKIPTIGDFMKKNMPDAKDWSDVLESEKNCFNLLYYLDYNPDIQNIRSSVKSFKKLNEQALRAVICKSQGAPFNDGRYEIINKKSSLPGTAYFKCSNCLHNVENKCLLLEHLDGQFDDNVYYKSDYCVFTSFSDNDIELYVKTLKRKLKKYEKYIFLGLKQSLKKSYLAKTVGLKEDRKLKSLNNSIADILNEFKITVDEFKLTTVESLRTQIKERENFLTIVEADKVKNSNALLGAILFNNSLRKNELKYFLEAKLEYEEYYSENKK